MWGWSPSQGLISLVLASRPQLQGAGQSLEASRASQLPGVGALLHLGVEARVGSASQGPGRPLSR